MSLSSSVFTKLPGQAIAFAIPKPCLYIKENKLHFIISTYFNEKKINPGIYDYNVETNKMNIISRYNSDDFYPDCHSQCIDSTNNIVYIFGGHSNTKCVALLNLKSKNKTIEYDLNNNLKKCKQFASSLFIASPFNQIHAMDERCHFIFDINKNNVIQLNVHKLNVRYPKILYIPLKQQLMILGSDSNNKIYFCNNSSPAQIEQYEWKDHPLTMPHSSDVFDYDILLAFTSLIFVFYFNFSGFNDIYCMDIKTNKWYKSKYNTPKCFTTSYACCLYAIKGMNNFVHLSDFRTGYHFKTNLLDVIPNNLYNTYSEYYKPLIFGFISEHEKTNIIPTIPFVVKQLIWRYYPSFV